MNAEIYYFTGTGNSLAVARDISRETGSRLISIPENMDRNETETNADVIGFVFPVYFASFNESGIPQIVRRCIGKLKNFGSAYIFAVCTHSGMPGKTIGNLANLLQSRGGTLSAGMSVKISIPYSTAEKLKFLMLHRELNADRFRDNKKQKKLFAVWQEKLKVLKHHIAYRKKMKPEIPGFLAGVFMTPLFFLSRLTAIARYKKLSDSSSASFDELVRRSDRSYSVSEHCNGCGICIRVCPVRNIKLIDNKPIWLHHCENCCACYQWCPQEAVGGEIVEFQKRYHHPDVKLSDFMTNRLP